MTENNKPDKIKENDFYRAINNVYVSERNTGIEPASQAWEARALPMC